LTDFYCCDKLIEFSNEEEFTIGELREVIGYDYCPFCGYDLDMIS